MSLMPTPHIAATEKEAFAKTVLMPGDPLRSKYIAETYLENAELVNNTRGVQGYTGYYKGKRVSVMASGMGIPSIGIYSYELFNIYDVNTIIRVGSAGAISPELKLRDIVFGMGACTNSAYASQFNLPGDFAPIADYETLVRAVKAAEKLGVNPVIGNLLSSDTFYDDSQSLSSWQKMGVLAVEMESAALYMNAARSGKKALAICTISDCPLKGGEECSALEREQTFNKMIEIALEAAE
ncbi:MAG: purine-nucleoside phosphorylase [Oscillospiraceae bacterium]|nr:purine-nucleoside phosphorylase [Oscillospiraceae bacterium]